MGKYLLTLMFNCKNQGGPEPETQLIDKLMHSFIPSFIHSKCHYNQQYHSALSTFHLQTQGELVRNHGYPIDVI